MKKFLFSVIIMLSLTISVAAASSQFEKKEAVIRDDFSVVINGELQSLENKVVVIDGVSYLPVRELSAMLEQDVSFGGGTIYIENNNVKPSEEKTIEEVKLEEVKKPSTIDEVLAEIEKNNPRDIDKERKDIETEIKIITSSIAYMEERKALFIKENRQDLADKMEISIQEQFAIKAKLEQQLADLK